MLALYKRGKTDAQVAHIIGVSVRTIHNWKGNFPDFFHALKDAKQVADDLVEASLFAKATGFSHVEEKIFCFEGSIIRAKTRRQYAPDTTAAIFWLKNRQPDRWRDRSEPVEAPPPLPGSLTRKSFADFCKAANYPVAFPKQDEMREFGLKNEEPRLLLGARGTGKTDYVTLMGLAYDLYCDWLDGIFSTNLVMSKSKTRNAAMVEEITKALQANGVPIEKSNTSLIRIKGLIGKDHSVEAITIRSSMRGRHPDRIVMDDPVTDEDVSEAMRTLVKRRYNEAMKLTSNVLVIGQPAHHRDLYAELRTLVLKLEVPWGSIPELDHDLEAQRLAGVDENTIQASYHLKIVTEGTTFFADIQYIDELPSSDGVMFIDPSDGGDYTAASIFKTHFDCMAVQGHVWKKAWYHCLDDIHALCKANGVRRICFETNMTGTQPVGQLRSLMADLKVGVVGKHSDSNKHAIIQSAGAYAHKLRLSKKSDRLYTDHVVNYEYGAKFDDAPDSLARGLEWLGLLKGKK